VFRDSEFALIKLLGGSRLGLTNGAESTARTLKNLSCSVVNFSINRPSSGSKIVTLYAANLPPRFGKNARRGCAKSGARTQEKILDM